MSDIPYALHLGGGLYMDSNGELHQGKPPNTPVYEAPYKLPIDPKVAKDVLKDVREALKDINEDSNVIEKFVQFGLPLELLQILSTVGKIAGIVAPVFAVASFAVDILKFFDILKDGPSPLERLVEKRFDELEGEVEAIKKLIRNHDLRDGRLAVESFSLDVKTHVRQLQNTNPSLGQLESDRSRLINTHATFITQISKLLDQQTWMSDFDHDEHTKVWPFVQGILFTLPNGLGESPWPAYLPQRSPQGSIYFDHRLMVPLASFAATSYITSIRGISPEYRTTGDFRDQLEGFAKKIDNLAQAMRHHVLARTIYKPSDFAWPVLINPHEVVHSGPLIGGSVTIGPTCNRWPVGAMDLRYHDDKFFGDFLTELIRNEFLGRSNFTTKRGLMNFRWIPPATLEPAAEEGKYQITNPEECAEAANAQAEKDYADLLATSGYLELLQLAMLFRNEATEPSKSQTVTVAESTFYRNPLPSSTVTVKSNPVRFTNEIITATARRESQVCANWVTIATQPIKRARPVQYRIMLRTLKSRLISDSGRETRYSDYQRVDYQLVPNQDQDDAHLDRPHPRFFRLALAENEATLFDERPLLDGWFSSPRDETKHKEGSVELKAHTFDWWIPVDPPFSIDRTFRATLMELRAAGWIGPHRASDLSLPEGSRQVLDRNNMLVINQEAQPFSNYYEELSWQLGRADWDGQHRDVKEEMVRVDYVLDWTGDQLYLILKNNPSHRNYVVFAVIEEKMPGSGQILHTAIPLPVDGQLTFVPRKFFEDEFEAHAQTASIIADLVARYIPTVDDIGPSDPIGWLRPGDLASRESLYRMAALVQEHQPELLQEILAERLP